MAVYIRYEDIRTMIDESSSRFAKWKEILESCSKSMEELTDCDRFSGTAADSVRCYLSEVHGMLMKMIEMVFSDFSGKFILYRDGYYQIDGNKDTVIKEGVLDDGERRYKNLKSDFERLNSNVAGAISSISDIASIPKPYGDGIISQIGKMEKDISRLNQSVVDYENAKASGEAAELLALISSVTLLIRDYGSGSVSPVGYTSRDYLKSSAFMDAVISVSASQDYLMEHMDEIEEAYNDESRVREEIQKEYEEELAKERAKAGVWQVIGGIGLAVVGVAAIVATAGAAAPIMAVGLVSGIGTCAFAGAEMYEGGENVKYGLNGDVTTVAWNPIRDTIFAGNQDIYDFTKEAFSTVAGLSITAAKAGNVAMAMRRSQYYGSGIKGACSRKIMQQVAVEAGVKSAAKEFAKDMATEFVTDKIVDPLIDGVGDGLGLNDATKDALKFGAGMIVDKGAGKIGGDNFDLPDGYDSYKEKRGVKKVMQFFEPIEDVMDRESQIKEIKESFFELIMEDDVTEENLGQKQVDKAQEGRDDYETWRKHQAIFAPQ